MFIFSVALSHSSCVTVIQGTCTVFPLFRVNTKLYYFLLSHWWPILIIMLCGLSCIRFAFFTHFFNGAGPFFFYNYYTSCLKCFSIVPKWTLPLLFLLTYWWSFLTFVLCGLLHIFYLLSKWNFTTLFCVNVTNVLCKISPLVLTGPLVELFRSPFFFLSYLWPIFFLILVGWCISHFAHSRSEHSSWLLFESFPTYLHSYIV